MFPKLLVMCNPTPDVPSGALEGEWASASCAAVLQHLHKPAHSKRRPDLHLWDGTRQLYSLEQPLPVGAKLRVVVRRPMDRPLSTKTLLRLDHLDVPPCSLHTGMRATEAVFKHVQVGQGGGRASRQWRPCLP